MSLSWQFTATELAAMQAAQAAHYMDTCTIGTYTDAGADANGNPNPSWVAGSALACGFQPVTPDELLDASNVPEISGNLRLPLTAVITSADRITITQRDGVNITAEVYEVVGIPKRGPSGFVVSLRRRTDG